MQSGGPFEIDDDKDLDISQEERDDSDSSYPLFTINSWPADFTLETLHNKFSRGELEIPDMQRNFVWTQKQASRLIESFLLGLPVPPIFLFQEPRTRKHMVVDGQQRLRSITFFFDGKITGPHLRKDTEFRLILNEKSEFNNLKYSDLSEEHQRTFRDSILRSIIMTQVEPDNKLSMYYLFERLNTGGTNLSNQEIRNCVYHGSFNEKLIALNLRDSWRKIYGNRLIHNRQRDVEFILRFFSLLDYQSYTKPLKDHMSTFMDTLQNAPPSKIEHYVNVFVKTCSQIVTHLGPRPFVMQRGMNTSVFDSVMVAFGLNFDNVPKNVAERFAKLKETPEYLDKIQYRTTDEKVLKGRIEIARSMLFDDTKGSSPENTIKF